MTGHGVECDRSTQPCRPPRDRSRRGGLPATTRSGGHPRATRSALGTPGSAWPARRHRAAVPVGTWSVRIRQHLLLRRCASRRDELEGILLRLIRCGQFDHGGQATWITVGDGPLGQDLRGAPVEHPGTAGAGRCCHGRCALRRRAALARPGGWSAGGRSARAHPRRSDDVPVQQSGRPARVAPHRGRVRGGQGDRGRPDGMAGHGGGARRPGLSDQDDAGLPGGTRAGVGLPGDRPGRAAQADRAATGGQRCSGGQLSLVGGHRRAVAGGGPALCRRLADQ